MKKLFFACCATLLSLNLCAQDLKLGDKIGGDDLRNLAIEIERSEYEPNHQIKVRFTTGLLNHLANMGTEVAVQRINKNGKGGIFLEIDLEVMKGFAGEFIQTYGLNVGHPFFKHFFASVKVSQETGISPELDFEGPFFGWEFGFEIQPFKKNNKNLLVNAKLTSVSPISNGSFPKLSNSQVQIGLGWYLNQKKK